MKLLPPLILGLLVGAGGARAQDPPDQDEPERSPVQQLFYTNCASCHGEKGDGQGWTQLDRQARSFQDGGFSFGNTPEALFRTITNGIPGTPMPAFDSSLSEGERRLLADYVVTLGPPVEEVDLDATILRVSDRPRIVRGYLPPIVEGVAGVEGATGHPRGLLVGATSGFTFEYRVDDVRLLGVRQGDFVERKDWVGRGGTALRPLGKIVHLVEGGAPAAPFDMAKGGRRVPLVGKLASSWVRGADAGITYRLRDDEWRDVATVDETCRAVGTSVGAGFERSFALKTTGETVYLSLRAGVYGERQDVARFTTLAIDVRRNPRGGTTEVPYQVQWTVWPRADETKLFDCIGIGAVRVTPQHLDGLVELPLEVSRDWEVHVSVTTLVLTDWTPEVHQALKKELR